MDRINNSSLPINIEPRIWWKRYRICDDHFSQHCRLPATKRLKKNSIPSLFLSDYFEDNVDNSIFSERSSLDQKNDSFSFEERHSSDSEEPMPSTSGIHETANQDHNIESFFLEERNLSESMEPIPSTSGVHIISDVSMKYPKGQLQVKKLRRANSRINILKSVNVENPGQLTPKARKMYAKVVRLMTARRKLLLKENDHKSELKMAYELSKEDFLSNVSPLAKKFILMQVNQTKKCPRGRRFSQEEKILALSIYKQGAGGYKILKAMGFALPSKQTLIKMMKLIRFRAGINSHIFKSLEKSVQKMDIKDRFCTLMFDEMSLQTSLFYDESLDEIIGLEDFGEEKRLKFSDHAQVFMLRGIRKKWKQPIVYAYSEHSMHKSVLAKLIKEILKKCHQIGLNVVATVCDQGYSNVAAINNLIKNTLDECNKKGTEYRFVGFEVEGKPIVPIFDPPHLLKGIRNNLLHKACTFAKNGKVHIAKWQHFIALSETEDPNENLRMCCKLSDFHLNENKMKKMKVSTAAQVFSNRVGVFFNFAINHKILPEECRGTQELAFFMDKLFDSVNGQSKRPIKGKEMRVALSPSSPHLAFWREAIRILESMQFIDSSKDKKTIPPSVRNWIKTINGLKEIWNSLKGEFEFLGLRNFNQDPLENFFAQIRSHGRRNVNPTPNHFRHSFLTLVINNFLSPKSLNSNCEDDHSEGVLSNLQNLISTKVSKDCSETINLDAIKKSLKQFNPSTNFMTINVTHYVAGFTAKAIVKKTKYCEVCRDRLLNASAKGVRNTLIRNRAYSARSLCTPNNLYAKIFEQIYFICKQLIPVLIVHKNLKKNVIRVIDSLIDFSYSCEEHNLKNLIINFTVHFYILNYIKGINNILRGGKKGEFSDPIKKAAMLKSMQWNKNKK